MWRITDDFWDDWKYLYQMFERCETWQSHVAKGCYPDCDMLHLGYIGKGFGKERYTSFTKEEQITMMTLWCIFRSPLMLGANLTKLDDWTKKLITNEKVLRLLTNSHEARQIRRTDTQVVWFSSDTKESIGYLAVFNLEESKQKIKIEAKDLGLKSFKDLPFEELWSEETSIGTGLSFEAQVNGHGAKLYSIEI